MKLIIGKEKELEVSNMEEMKDLSNPFWILTVDAQGEITSQELNTYIVDNKYLKEAYLQDDNNTKDLSTLEIIGSINLYYGDSLTESAIRIKFKE